MGTVGVHQKLFKPSAPIKGSFPLDHDGVCKRPMLEYMMCLTKNDQENSNCRNFAKDYFACRMKNGLMAKEDWQKLGYGDLESSNT